MKLMIPLLDENIKLEDLDEKAGFVDAFVHDKNRPYLDNHIFLVYDISKNTTERGRHEHNFAFCKNIYNEKVVYIKGKPYKIVAFPMIGSELRNLYNGFRPIQKNNVVRILSFWRGYDEDVNDEMLTAKAKRLDRDWKSIPEYDYQPKPLMCFGNKI